MTCVTLEQAEKIIDAIIAQGAQEKLRPLSVVVVEPGCVVKAFKKEDGSAMMRFEMAYGKAYARLRWGVHPISCGSAEHRPMFMDYMIGASGGKIFPEGGGHLIRDNNGDVIGAVGVTGDLQHKDDELAAYGIRAVGLKTDEDCATLGTQVRVTRD